MIHILEEKSQTFQSPSKITVTLFEVTRWPMAFELLTDSGKSSGQIQANWVNRPWGKIENVGMDLNAVIYRGICLKWPSYTQINEILQYLGCSYWWPIRQRPITKRCTFFGAFYQNFGTFAVMVRSTQFSWSPVGWVNWPIWIPRLSGYLYFGTQKPAKKKPKLDVWEDFLIHKRRIWAIVQTPVISRVWLILFSPELPEQGETVNVLIFAGADIRHVVWGPMHQEKTRMKFPLLVVGTDRLEGPEPENRESNRLLLESSMVTMAKPLDIHDLNEPQKHKVI